MPEIYFSRSSQRAEQIFAEQPDLLAKYQKLNDRRDSFLRPNQPYLMSCSPGDEVTLQAFSRFSHPEMQRLQQISAAYDDYTLAIAYTTEEQINPIMALLDEYGLTAAGAIVGAANSKYSAFQRSIVSYQQALVALHDASQAKLQASGARTKSAHNSVIASKAAHAKRVHAEMVQRFQAQLQRYHANLSSQAGRSALLNAERGINIARSGRRGHQTSQSLHFANSQQVATVQRFVNGTQIIGRGLLVLDFGSRTHKVMTAQGDATRMAVTQYSGFAAGALTGYAFGKGSVAAISAISLGLTLTPVGWVILIGSAAILGFTAATAVDNWAQNETGYVYDRIRGRR